MRTRCAKHPLVLCHWSRATAIVDLGRAYYPHRGDAQAWNGFGQKVGRLRWMLVVVRPARADMNGEQPGASPPDFLGTADTRAASRTDVTIAVEPEVQNTQFRRVATSRFFSNVSQDGITYGAIVATVSAGGSPLETALIGAASVIPAATIGVYGGAIADALPKRAALALGYVGQAAVCLAIPLLFGTDAIAMIALILLVNVAGQVSGPAESAIVPLVVPEAQLGRAASVLSFVGAAGTAGGTAVVAPIVVSLFGVRPLFFLAALAFAVAVAQVARLPGEPRSGRLRIPRDEVGYRASLHWLLDHPSVATMLLVAAVAGTSTKILQTLSPGYVHTVFDMNPAKSVYVFAPTSLGMVGALVIVPWLLRVLGERRVALIGVLLASIALVLLGIITHSTELLEPLNPLLRLRRLDAELSPEVLTAAALAVPVGFGVNATAMAVTVYIQKRVRPSYQGRAFALNSVLKNLVTIGPLLLAGAVASAIGEQWVLFFLPAILVLATSLLIGWSYRLTGRARRPNREILDDFLYEPELPAAERSPE